MLVNPRRPAAARAAAALVLTAFIASCAGAPARSAPVAVPIGDVSEPAKAEAAPLPAEAAVVVPAEAPVAASTESTVGTAPTVVVGDPVAAPPELSFAERSPPSFPLIVASLHEPEPPVRRSAVSVAALPDAAPVVPSALPEPEPRKVEVPAAGSATAAKNVPVAEAPAATTKAPPKAAAAEIPKAAAKEVPKAASKTPPEVPAKESPAAEEAPKAASVVLPLAPPSGAESALVQPERQEGVARSVSAEAGMRVEVPFDGTGWTYLGEKTGREGVLYETRRFAGNGLVFVLLADKPGEYVLRFQRQDALRGISYDELVALAVAPKAAIVAPPQATSAAAPGSAGDQGAVAAQGTAAQSAEAAPKGPAAAKLAAAGSAAPAAVAAPAADSPEGLILQAKNELGAGRAQSAIEALDRLLARYPSGIDEAFYVYALALEQNGPLKDIKRAYALYKKVCADYPQSAFWDAAAARISYIERHYFEIR